MNGQNNKHAAKKIRITRQQYKNFKRMDHKQVEDFIVNLYNEGFSDGKEAVGAKRIKPSDIAIAITEVKGIGTKKAAEIMAAVNKLYEKGEEAKRERTAEEKTV